MDDSVVEDRELELTEARRIGNDVDLDDPAARDREPEHAKQPATRSHDNSYRPVHERGSCGPGTL